MAISFIGHYLRPAQLLQILLSQYSSHLPPGSLLDTMKRASGRQSPEKAIGRTTKPKRCLTAYNFFFQEERKRIIEASAGLSGRREEFAPLSKQIAERWSQASLAVRREYEMLAETDRLRYAKELQEWQQTLLDSYEESRAVPAFLSSTIPSGEPLAESEHQRRNASYPEVPAVFTDGDQKALAGRYSKPRTIMGGALVDHQTYMGLDMHQRNLASLTLINAQGDQLNVLQSRTLPLSVPQWALVAARDLSTTSNNGTTNMDTDNDRIYRESLSRLAASLDDECINFIVTRFSEESQGQFR